MSSASASTSTVPSTSAGGTGGGNSSRPVLGPAWYRGGGGHGNRGFQPPPAVSGEGRSQEEPHHHRGPDIEGKNTNSYSTLLHSDTNGGDDQLQRGVNKMHSGDGENSRKRTGTTSRSEGLLGASGGRQGSYSRTSSSPFSGIKHTGKSLAELVASKPSGVSRAQSGGHTFRDAQRNNASERHEEAAEKKPVIRYTRERLLSLRPQPKVNGESYPSFLKHLVGTVVLSTEPQEPVCFDDFDADEIWAQPSRPPNRNNTQKTIRTSLTDANRGESHENARQNGGGGRWQRGIALPPSSSRDRRHDDDATSPEELWDDPVGLSSPDLSQFGGPIDGRRPRENSVGSNQSAEKVPETEALSEWKDISDAASRFDKELHSENNLTAPEEQLEPDIVLPTPIDPQKPLASIGTTIQSGSADDVNVFEDFGEPVVDLNQIETKDIPTTEKIEPNELSASSKLMQMIGIPVTEENETNTSKLMSSWGTSPPTDNPINLETSFGNVGGFISSVSSVPKNPWGSALLSIDSNPAQTTEGFDLAARLEAAVAEQKARQAKADAEAAAEEQRRRESEQRQQELLRRQKEEEDEAKRVQALLRAQMEAQHAAAQQARQAAEAQRQAAAAQAAAAAGRVQYNSQVEAILLERVSTVLENSWGRADLMAILRTLHMEDARVVALLGSIEALKALLSRHPQRIALAKEPSYGVDVAILIMSNAQWNQHKSEQEEIQRQQQQIKAAQVVAEVKAVKSSVSADSCTRGLKTINAPWFYADPQGNIQGPFGGEEMRQWLDAGYFKGDLPISQDSKGPFRTLLSIFPDPAVAFQAPSSNNEEQRNLPLVNTKNKTHANIKEPNELIVDPVDSKELDDGKVDNSKSPTTDSNIVSSDQNASSVQLKLLLGLGGSAKNPSNSSIKVDSTNESEVIIAGPPSNGDKPMKNEVELENSIHNAKSTTQQTAKSSTLSKNHPTQKKSSHNSSIKSIHDVTPLSTHVINTPTSSLTATTVTPTPAPSAWGGAAVNKPVKKKSMSEIQQEEARVAAIHARDKAHLSRNSSGGWANIAASGGGSSGWSSGAVKQTAPAVIHSQSQQAKTTARPQIQQKQLQQQQASRQRVSSQKQTVDDFGASMSPALESWCKEKMQKLTGSDDLTLISFCMSLNDSLEIRQYLTAYLGSSSEVNNFANEFISRKGGNKIHQEEWESADKAKKGRKKKLMVK